MKFATAVVNQEPVAGIIKADQFIPLHDASRGKLPKAMLDAIQLGEQLIHMVSEMLQTNLADFAIPLDSLKLLAPIPRPQKNIFCVGKNYAAHAIELGSEEDIPKAPIFFSKTPTTVIGPNEKIQRHENVTNALDYEGELAVVIGKSGHAISEENALDYVFGYTIINDVTARDLQERHVQYLLGKSLDGSCPMGPYIVHKSLVPNPHQLSIETKVGEEVRQKATTNQMIFKIPTLISTLSQGMTLEAGDIIATGTPAGVGMGYQPPKYLQSGDTIEISIEGIGTLTNSVE